MINQGAGGTEPVILPPSATNIGAFRINTKTGFSPRDATKSAPTPPPCTSDTDTVLLPVSPNKGMVSSTKIVPHFSPGGHTNPEQHDADNAREFSPKNVTNLTEKDTFSKVKDTANACHFAPAPAAKSEEDFPDIELAYSPRESTKSEQKFSDFSPRERTNSKENLPYTGPVFSPRLATKAEDEICSGECEGVSAHTHARTHARTHTRTHAHTQRHTHTHRHSPTAPISGVGVRATTARPQIR